MAPRETENNAYAKFWRDKQRTLWYVMVFLEWSIGKLYILFKTQNLENHTLFSRTYPQRPNKGVHGGGGGTFNFCAFVSTNKSLLLNLRYNVKIF